MKFDESKHPRADDGRFTKCNEYRQSKRDYSNVLEYPEVMALANAPPSEIFVYYSNDDPAQSRLRVETELEKKRDFQLRLRMEEYLSDLASEPRISEDIATIAENIGSNTLEFAFRVKGADSFLRKATAEPNRTISDNVRYTFEATPNNTVQIYNNSIKALKDKGYEQIEVRNYWEDKKSIYKGVNTKWKSPEGTIFEIQYHSKENMVIKAELHPLYCISRDTAKYTFEERENALNMQCQIAKKYIRPNGIEKIVNFRSKK